MTTKMTLREGILDSLADGGESIIQIIEYLNYLNILVDRKIIKDLLVILLNESVIYISYPGEKSIIDFLTSNEITEEDFWFELTSKGKDEWNKIVI